MRRLSILLALVFAVTLATPALAQTTFNVSASGLTAWRIDGVLNPTLNLQRGQTYVFSVTAPLHEFYIKTAQVIGAGSQYTNGVTGNGTSEGEVTWTIPGDAPGLLYYQCGIHLPMTGVINITSAAPGLDGKGLAMLSAMLAAAGYFVLRRRVRTA